MTKRQPGRRSAASLAVVPIGGRQRVEPPDWLAEPARQLWRETVAVYSPEWFDGVLDVLAGYCADAISLRRLQAKIDHHEAQEGTQTAAETQAYARLLRQRTAMQGALVTAARQLRLTPQTRFRRETAGSQHGLQGTPLHLWEPPGVPPRKKLWE
jgi:phage terminase small subunit